MSGNNIGYTVRRQKINTICVRHYYAQTNTNNMSPPSNNWR